MKPGVAQERPLAYLTPLLAAFGRYADRTLFVHEGKAITYGQARAEIFRLARALAECGLKPGDGVAGLNANTPRMVFVHLAAQLIGCYYVGVPLPASTAERARMLAHTRAKALVYESAVDSGQVHELSELSGVETVLSLGPSTTGRDLVELAVRQPTEPLTPLAQDKDVAELVFTGGSSGGKPKAATYTFERIGALSEYWDIAARENTPDYAVYSTGSCRLLRVLAHIGAPGLSVVPTMLHGGTIVLQEGFDAGTVLRAIERERITSMGLAPAQLYQLLDHPDFDTTETSSLQLIVYFGAPIAPARLKQAVERFGPILFQSYGQSETRMISALYPADHVTGRSELLRSAGRPRTGVEVRIRQGGTPLGPGQVGEICVRSPYLMNGYWDEPELTERTMGDGWIRTGDAGYQDAEGYLYLVDRLRDMVIVNASNVHTLEIEDLLTSHPDVTQAAVVGLPDERTGEAVHAAVVVRPGSAVDEEDLRVWVRNRGDARQEPQTVVFLDAIPLTRLGKPDKNAIRSELARQSGER